MATVKSENPAPKRSLAGVELGNDDSVYRLPKEQQYKIGAYSNYVDNLLRQGLMKKNADLYPEFEKEKIAYMQANSPESNTFDRDIDEMFQKHRLQPLDPKEVNDILIANKIDPRDYELLNRVSLGAKWGYLKKDPNDPSFFNYGGEHIVRGVPSGLAEGGYNTRYTYDPKRGEVVVTKAPIR